MASTRNNQDLAELARLINPAVRGWMNYYGRFYRSRCVEVLRYVNVALARWVRWKYRQFRCRERASKYWLGPLQAGLQRSLSCGNLASCRRFPEEEPDEARVSRPVP